MDKLLVNNQKIVAEELEKNKIKIEFDDFTKFTSFVETISTKIYKNARLHNYLNSVEMIEYELDVLNKKPTRMSAISLGISTLDGTEWEEKYKKILKYRGDYYGVLGTAYSLSWSDKLFGQELCEMSFTFPEDHRKYSKDDRFSMLLGKRFVVGTPKSSTIGLVNIDFLDNFDDSFLNWIKSCGPNVMSEYSDSNKKLVRLTTPRLPEEKIVELYNFDFIKPNFIENLSQLKYPHEQTDISIIFDLVENKIVPKVLLQIKSSDFIDKVTQI